MAKDESKTTLDVHRVRFYEHKPLTINCMAYDDISQRIAISRSDASVQILNTKDSWTQELYFPGSADASVEDLAWCKGRLFAAGLGGNVVELDLQTQLTKDAVSSNTGPIWCLVKNAAEDQLAAGTEDGCVVLFDVTDDLCFLRSFGRQIGRILSIAWYNKDEENIIITGGVNIIRLWSVKSGQAISRMTLGRLARIDTLVWCIAVTRDFTVVSGDSRGVVTFWNGKESTQIKTFHCHKADVLTLCLNQDGTAIFSGGVDGSLFRYSRGVTNPSQHVRWIHQALHLKHTHDIRAVAYVNGCLASGGVDSMLEVARVDHSKPSIHTISYFAPAAVVHVAKESNQILLQYPKFIEVWRLGSADSFCEFPRGILPLQQKPMKLVQLKARSGQEILGSAISSHGTLAFSDSKSLRVYELKVDTSKTNQPQASLNRVHTAASGTTRLMTFTPDARHLIFVHMEGGVQVLNFKTNLVTRLGKSAAPIHLLSASPNNKHFAFASTDHKVQVHSVESGELVCACPVLQSQVTSLAFSPHGPWLAIAYSNHSIYEMDISKKEYTAWCRQNSHKFEANWLRPLKQISNIFFSPDNPDVILLHTDVTLAMIDKSKLAEEQDEIKLDEKFNYRFGPVRKCKKYKYLLFADFLSNGMMVVVEVSPSTIDDALPPSLRQKKFGIS